jgi:hypothetical protein
MSRRFKKNGERWEMRDGRWDENENAGGGGIILIGQSF